MNVDAAKLRLAGYALIAAAVIVNPWSVGALLTEDGSIEQIDRVAVIALFDWLCLLGGAQLLWRWVERIAWDKRTLARRDAIVVALSAATIAGLYWGIATFNRGHEHTVVIPAELAAVTDEQRAWAADFYRASLAAALKHGWFDIERAFADGFQPDRINRTHFPNLDNMFDDVILDPERPEWLVYHDSPDGKVLMALMFFTRELEEVGPTPAGPLAQWHYHPYRYERCAIKGLWTVGNTDSNGECAEGIPVTRTPEMFHVWFIDHPLGRFTEMKIVPDYWQEEGFDIRLWHPILVHFALALFVVSVLLDGAGTVLRKPGWHAAGWINLVLAAVATVATIGLGMTAEVYLTPTAAAHETLDVHKLLAFTSLAIMLVLLVWRYQLHGRFPVRGAVLYLVVAFTGVAVIGGAGYFGGEMVYRHGAAVRAIDQFTRERYWEQVKQIYRNPEVSGFVVETAVP